MGTLCRDCHCTAACCCFGKSVVLLCCQHRNHSAEAQLDVHNCTCMSAKLCYCMGKPCRQHCAFEWAQYGATVIALRHAAVLACLLCYFAASTQTSQVSSRMMCMIAPACPLHFAAAWARHAVTVIALHHAAVSAGLLCYFAAST